VGKANLSHNIIHYHQQDPVSGMVPKTKEILFYGTFPGQNYHFPGQSIQYLKVINQDACKKAYHIYSM